MTIDQVICLLKERGSHLRDPISDGSIPAMAFSCAFSPNGARTEDIQPIAGTCPIPLQEFWRITESGRLFEDSTYGQWGLEILRPKQATEATRVEFERHPIDYIDGDLVIGRFLGDSDLLIIRCDESSPDFGRLLVALPLDPREEWYKVADSFEDFLSRYVEAKGDKYWEHRQ